MSSIDSLVRKNKRLRFEPSGATYFRGEGESGVRNLARLCHALGYSDPFGFGQFEGASFGDLISFLEDNPGAVEAIVSWIEDNHFSDEEEDDLQDDEDD